MYFKRAQAIEYRSITFSSKACFHSKGQAVLLVIPEIFKVRIVRKNDINISH